MKNLTEQEIVRRQKMEDLRAKGIDPFGSRYERTATTGEIKEKMIHKHAHPQIEIVEALRVIATQPIDSP